MTKQITVDLYSHPLRHDYGRKCSEFSDAPVVIVRESDLAGLQRFTAEEIGVVDSPFDDISNMPLVFILEFEGDEYVVNTEGFNYCRYIFKIGGKH